MHTHVCTYIQLSFPLSFFLSPVSPSSLALALKMAVEQRATARGAAPRTANVPKRHLPISQVIGPHVFRPGELAEYDLVLTFDYFLLVDIILPQQTQRIRHDHKTTKLCKTSAKTVVSLVWLVGALSLLTTELTLLPDAQTRSLSGGHVQARSASIINLLESLSNGRKPLY